MNILLTVEELAKYLRIKPDTIYKKVRRGELPAIKLGKLVRFPKELIDQWLIEQANKTMKDVRAAKQAVETKVGEAMLGVKKTAKAASKIIGEVPEVIQNIKKAPLNKKQAILTQGLRTLWKDFNASMGKPLKIRSKTKIRSAKTRKTTRSKSDGADAIRGSAKNIDSSMA